ncbi:beta galactosidase jelly roll domain-containing protein [Streptomyces sp. NBC_00846]|uniref:beta galactosidase jelly roll domain-containing protein n=1 Tax=Streptomyces sp. NBC_00846 TaxID=2975849 RepID=UPI0038661CFB|nr:beta galactosidase jelly roll domain-containing protein [Streptomyces sp. NBC_00846]
MGWHLPGAPDSSWPRTNSLKSERPGARWYRTTARLDQPQGTDAAVGLRINDAEAAQASTASRSSSTAGTPASTSTMSVPRRSSSSRPAS